MSINETFNFASKKIAENGYSAKDIEVLEGVEAVRKRPGMYIGGTDNSAMHHLVSEIFDNSMDEALAGYANQVEIIVEKDNQIIITDNGRGIPIDEHPKFPGKSALEVIMTTLHSGGKFSNNVYKTAGGLHGVGISVVNALSDKMEVQVIKNGEIWQQFYSRGKAVSKLEKIGSANKKNGTKIFFHPDPEIFGHNKFNPLKIYKFAKSKAYLSKSVKVKWKCEVETDDQMVPKKEELYFPEGIKDYLKTYMSEDESRFEVRNVFYGEEFFEKNSESKIEWAISWDNLDNSFLKSYCNTITTPLGGTHEAGFRSALLKGLKSYGELVNNKKARNISSEDIMSGAISIISVFINEPQFQGQTKEKLVNANVTRQIESLIKDHFENWLSANPPYAEGLLNFIIEKSDERLQKKTVKDVGRKSFTKKMRLPGKLADCTSEASKTTEIFIVEGESAGGSAKQARDRKTQAILPLRGKILNVANSTEEKITQNQELKDLELALGCGKEEFYDEKNLRYDKVIIMTDADVDGSHITSLLMTFFYKKMPKLIEQGHLFLANPPLYKIVQSGKVFYAFNEKHKEELLSNLNSRGKIEISRFKGLGEMTPIQLKETTMDLKTRSLTQISINHSSEEQEIVYNLMGKKPELRFQFIQKEALEKASFIKDKLDL